MMVGVLKTRMGEYRILSTKSGGFCDVYVTQDLETGRFKALKRLKEEFVRNRSLVDLFRQEAEIWIELSKSSRTLASGYLINAESIERIGNIDYIQMEYINGENLSNYLRMHRIPFEYKLRLFSQFCMGMVDADTAVPGIVHCDIKPDNILVGCRRWVNQEAGLMADLPPDDHYIRIADFGLARIKTVDSRMIQDEGDEYIKRIKNYSRLNPYAAPECRRSDSAYSVRSDIFSFGMVMVIACLSPSLSKDDTNGLFMQLSQGVRVSQPVLRQYDDSISADFESIVYKCLNRNPDQRFENFHSLQSALWGIADNRSIKTVHMRTTHEVSYIDLAIGAFEMGNYPKAEELFDKAIETAEGDHEKAHALANKAAFHMNMDQDDEAEKLIDLALGICDESFFAWHVKGHYYFKKGALASAVGCYDRCIQLHADWQQAHIERNACIRILNGLDFTAN
jgi:serine/threonine protein kinase